MFIDTLNPVLGYFRPMMMSFAAGGGGGAADDTTDEGADEIVNEDVNGDTDDSDKKGEKPTSWRDELPDDLRANPIFEKYKSKEDAFKALVEAQKLIGKKGIIPPDENASKEEWNNFYKALGRPDKPQDYKLPEIEDLPDGMPVQKERIEEFKAVAHELGLNPKQAGKLYEWYQKTQAHIFNEEVNRRAEEKNNAETELRKEWGRAYDSKILSAQKAFKSVLDERDLAYFEQHGNDLPLVRTFSKVAELLGEDKIGGEAKRLTKTPDEAKEEIKKIKLDPGHPFNVENHPEHEMAVKYVDSLYRMAYPELVAETKMRK